MSTELNFGASRKLITRVTISACLLLLFWRWTANNLPGNWNQPPLFNVGYDFTMWFFKLSGLYHFLSQPLEGTLFTAALFASGFFLIIFPLKRVFAILFATLYFIEAISFNMFICANIGYQFGFILLLFAFCARGNENFSLWWQTMRYYFCFAYSLAFLWKIFYGAIFDWNTGMAVFRPNLAEYFYHFPDTTMTHIYIWFLNHPFLVNAGHKLVMIVEGAFLIAFVTRKMDWLLIVGAFFIFGTTYIFIDVFFLEFLIMVLTLIKPETWMRFQRVLPTSSTIQKPLKTYAVAD